MPRLLFLILALLAPSLASAAPHIAASLVSESARPAPGKTTPIAFAMTPARGWHGYWQNPGDTGMETRVSWTLPPGITATPLAYPVPERLIVGGLMNYVYGRPFALLAGLALSPDIRPGTPLPIQAKLDWLECTDEICVPASATMALDLVAGDGEVSPASSARFDTFRAALPRPLDGEASFSAAGDSIRVAIPVPAGMALTDAYFFPTDDGVIDYAAPQALSRSGDRLIVETSLAGDVPSTVSGVLRIDNGSEHIGLALSARPGSVPSGGTAIGARSGGEAAAGTTMALTILTAFAGAVIGGLLLNIMPCVFPILSLKALSLARAGESEATARREALAYTAGVILVCLALGAVLLGLRAGGAAAGWAFQLQDPRVILFLLLLVTAVGLNLAGLFHLATFSAGERLAGKGGTAGAFWTGALAAFVATPCTGPFMGAALGAALVLPPAAALAIFGGLGLGLALPFLLLGFVPVLRSRLPRPGPWMERFRNIMAVPMLLTALALTWVLGRQAGVDGMTLGLAAALVTALALWWIGRRQAKDGRYPWLPLAPAGIAAAAALALVTPQATAEPAGTTASAFSEQALAAMRADGKPVFLYFTADWCVTCKVNEKAAIERSEVRAAFERAGIATMVGDWTNGDGEIGRFLASHGRSGVPLYLYYPPGEEAQVLPQILTPQTLTALAG